MTTPNFLPRKAEPFNVRSVQATSHKPQATSHKPQATSHKRLFVYSILILAGELALTSTTQAVTFTPLIKSGDQMPGGGKYDTFFSFSRPRLDGNITVFGSVSSGSGLWSIEINRGLSSAIKLVDGKTPIPQGSGNFDSFSPGNTSQIVGDKVFFKGEGLRDQEGFYSVSASGGVVTMLVNQDTPVPKGKIGEVFGNSIYSFKASPGNFLINREGSLYYIMKDIAGSKLSPFGCFYGGRSTESFDISNNNVMLVNKYNKDMQKDMIMAGSLNEMLNRDYRESCSNAFTFPESFTSIDTVDNFYFTSQIDGDTVVFVKEEFGLRGLYSSIATQTQGRQIRKLVDEKTIGPSTEGYFNFYDISALTYSLSGNRVALKQPGIIYLSSTTGDSLTKIIAVGDILDGDKQVTSLDMTEDSLSGNHLVFVMGYKSKNVANGSVLYLATLPPDSSPTPDPKNCLMNWAEATYPALFSTATSTQTLAPYTYRYYKIPNAYLGISSADNHVYYLGADGVLKDAGDLAGWLTTANCQ